MVMTLQEVEVMFVAFVCNWVINSCQSVMLNKKYWLMIPTSLTEKREKKRVVWFLILYTHFDS